MARERKLGALLEDIYAQVEKIMVDFSPFISGTRVLLLLLRTKDGGHNKEHVRRHSREVAHSPEQIRKALTKLMILKATMRERDYRIYMSSAPRDLRKAELQFKTDLLQVDFTGNENKEYFYQHIEDKWISSLMKSNPMQGQNVFILDVDHKEDEPTKDILAPVLKWCAENKIEIIHQYPTKNGWHIAVKPFNRKLYPSELGEVKDDGLLLLDW